MAKKGRPEIDIDSCKGCGLCIRSCPKKILEFSSDFNRSGVAYPVCIDEDSCIACKFCAITCPDSVIQIEDLSAGGQA